MRKYNPALEAALAGDEGRGNEELEVSMEEDELIREEAAELSTDISTSIADAQRTIEVADSIENAADAVEGVEVATPAEVELVEIVGDVAVAGTDFDSTEIVPVMEGFKGGKIATEGLRETARRIWESIQKYIAEIWNKIKQFFYKIFATIPRLRRAVADAQDRVSSVSSLTAKEKSFKIGSGLKAISVKGVPVKNEAALKTALDDTVEAVRFAFNDHAGTVASVGEKLAAAVGRFDAKQPEKSAQDVLEVFVAGGHGGKGIPGGKSGGNRYKGYQSTVGKDLLGNVQLVAKIPTEAKGDTSVLRGLELALGSGVSLDHSQSAKEANEAEVAVLSPSAMGNALTECMTILDTLEAFNKGAKKKAIEKAQADIKAGSGKADSAVGANRTGTAAERAVVPYFRSVLNTNVTFARWGDQPFVQLSSAALSAVRGVLLLVAKSTAQYK